MTLTGKCKTDFENWLISSNIIPIIPNHSKLTMFNAFHFSMQYGIYVDFFDSVGISLMIYGTDYDKWFLNILTKGRYFRPIKDEYKTRNIARDNAILKANEIYNSIKK